MGEAGFSLFVKNNDSNSYNFRMNFTSAENAASTDFILAS